MVRKAFDFPEYSRGEQRADAVVHAAGVMLGLLAFGWLTGRVWAPSEPGLRAALTVYGLGMLAMLTASALYNLAPHGRGKELLRRLDHAMIFVAIAATYTPFVALRLASPLGIGLCIGVWAGALAGVAIKLFAPRRFERLSLVMYLGLGWMALPAISPLSASLASETLRLIVVGGAIYTAGVIAHLVKRLPYHNAVWHAFVLAAAICHFAAMRTEFGF